VELPLRGPLVIFVILAVMLCLAELLLVLVLIGRDYTS